jgi:hypothetical protein
MAERHSEFEKLLSEAPMESDADTVALVGSLARTEDPACFVLRTPDGRSCKLEVNAVKSAKSIASAIGQSLVELELDAKRVPEQFRSGQSPFVAAAAQQVPAETMAALAQFGTRTYLTAYQWTNDQHIPYKLHLDQPVTPFAAAMPHQADAATQALLAFPLSGNRTYISPYNWTFDYHHFPKVRLDPLG